MSSSFGTTVARHRRPRFRHSLVWEPAADQRYTNRFGERGISTPTCWGLLKQPDNQKTASIKPGMATGSKIFLTQQQHSELSSIAQSRTLPAGYVFRAKLKKCSSRATRNAPITKN